MFLRFVWAGLHTLVTIRTDTSQLYTNNDNLNFRGHWSIKDQVTVYPKWYSVSLNLVYIEIIKRIFRISYNHHYGSQLETMN